MCKNGQKHTFFWKIRFLGLSRSFIALVGNFGEVVFNVLLASPEKLFLPERHFFGVISAKKFTQRITPFSKINFRPRPLQKNHPARSHLILKYPSAHARNFYIYFSYSHKKNISLAHIDLLKKVFLRWSRNFFYLFVIFGKNVQIFRLF